MRTALCIAAFTGLAYSAPQLIDLDKIAIDFAPPKLIKPLFNVISDITVSSTAAA